MIMEIPIFPIINHYIPIINHDIPIDSIIIIPYFRNLQGGAPQL